MAKFVRRITLIELGGTSRDAQTVYKAKTKKRKLSKWAKPLEKMQRKLLQAQSTFADESLRRHSRSNRKRRNGWLRDGLLNAMSAQRKAAKKLR